MHRSPEHEQTIRREFDALVNLKPRSAERAAGVLHHPPRPSFSGLSENP